MRGATEGVALELRAKVGLLVALGRPPLLPAHGAQQELRRLKRVTQDIRSGIKWRFRGFEREGPNIKDPSAAASEFEWTLEVDHAAQGRSCGTGTLWWNKLRSRHGTHIELCHLLLHVSVGTVPNEWTSTHELRKQVQSQKAVIQQQAERLEEQARRLTALGAPPEPLTPALEAAAPAGAEDGSFGTRRSGGATRRRATRGTSWALRESTTS